MGAPGELPAEIKWFPERPGSHSVRYPPRDVLGQAYLKEGFEALSSRRSQTKLVVTTRAAPKEPEALARYRQFTAGSGR